MQFLLADSILLALDNVTNGLVIYPSVIRSRINEELPFSASLSASLGCCNPNMCLSGHRVHPDEALDPRRVPPGRPRGDSRAGMSTAPRLLAFDI